MEPTRPSQKPLSICKLFSVVLGVYLAAFPIFIALNAIGMVLSLPGYTFPYIDALFAVSGLFYLGSTVAGYLVWSATLWAALAVLRQEEAGFKTAIAYGARRALMLFATSIVTGFALSALFVTIIGIPFAIYLAVRWALVWPIAVNEREFLFGVLGRSWQLTRRRWCRTFVAHFLAYVLMLVPAGLLFVLAGWAFIDWSALWDTFDDTEAVSGLPLRDFGLVQVLIGLIVVAGGTLIAPFYGIFSAVLYDDYRRLEARPEPPADGPQQPAA